MEEFIMTSHQKEKELTTVIATLKEDQKEEETTRSRGGPRLNLKLDITQILPADGHRRVRLDISVYSIVMCVLEGPSNGQKFRLFRKN
jgi:hypothetical protein